MHSWPSIRRARSSKARSATSRNSVSSSASTTAWTAWSISRTSTGRSRRPQVIKDFKKGDSVKAIVLDVDSSKERISLGIKQLGGDPADELSKYKKGDTVTCEVVAVQENGIEVKIADTDITTFVKRSDLSRDRSEQRSERFTVGQRWTLP